MQLDFSAVITDLKGAPLKGADGAEFTIGDAVGQAAVAQLPGDVDKATGNSTVTGEDKHKRFKLAVLASGSGPKELSAEQVVVIKDLVGRAFGSLVVGRVYDMLEGTK